MDESTRAGPKLAPATPATSPEPSTRTPPPKLQVPNMCLACGQMLKGDEEKCPSCGAVIRGRRPERRSTKLTIATALFLSLVLIVLTVAGLYIFAQDQLLVPGQGIGDFRFPVSGSVEFANGTAASDVLVWVDEARDNATRTDANGSYALGEVPYGFHRVNFEKANHTQVQSLTFLIQRQFVNATLAPGNGTVVVEDDSYGGLERLLTVCGGLYALLGVLLTGAALACLRRRLYPLALTGAWMSLLVLLVLPQAVLVSLVLIILVMRSKREFR